MIDIGSNLAHKSFQRDLDEVLARATAAGVTAIIATGTSVEASRAVGAIAQSGRYASPELYCTAGVHPHHASMWSLDVERAIGDLASSAAALAVGECGLDFERNFSPRDAQLRAFEAQIELAIALARPLFLHERAAHGDMVSILARHRSRLTRGGVVHCFTGGEEEAARYLDLDLHIGITGWICDERRGTDLRKSVRRVPASRLMIETDAPFLLPRDLPRTERPSDGRNEPRFLPRVLEAIARAREEDPATLRREIETTTRAFFALPRPASA